MVDLNIAGYGELIESLQNEIIEKNKIIATMDAQCMWLSALKAAGVDNWEGYSVAIDILEDWGTRKW